MIKVKDWPRAKGYYEVAFKPLGYVLLKDGGTWGGFHRPGEETGRIYVKQEASPTRIHFAIQAPSTEAVKEYYQAALKAGGTDNDRDRL
ncbi:hypothetical protein WJX72_000377 [[Myrmecia] bisecta]|uniref:Uncharacterized protein n=1 Tax=[Myrmecia] bisecta TaxID=41462 RepID=A0AAW1PJ58_9CHLO